MNHAQAIAYDPTGTRFPMCERLLVYHIPPAPKVEQGIEPLDGTMLAATLEHVRALPKPATGKEIAKALRHDLHATHSRLGKLHARGLVEPAGFARPLRWRAVE